MHLNKAPSRSIMLVAAIALLVIGAAMPTSAAFLRSGKTKISFWTMQTTPELMSAQIKLKEIFEAQNPDIEVEIVPVPWPEAHGKYITAWAARAMPDCGMNSQLWIPEFVEMGAMYPIDEFTRKWPYEKDMCPTLHPWDKYKGKTYGLPFFGGTDLLFYRKDLFKKYGVERPPATWSELIEIGPKLTRDTNGDGRIDMWAFGLTGSGSPAARTFVTILKQNGGDVFDEKGNPALYTKYRTQAVKSMQLIVDLYKKHKIVPPSSLTDGEAERQKLFFTGNTCMAIIGPWTLSKDLADAKKLGIEFGIAPVPTDGRPWTQFAAEPLFIYSTSKNKEAAWKWISFLNEPPAQILWSAWTFSVPASVSVRKLDLVHGNQYLGPFIDSMATAGQMPVHEAWPPVEMEICSQMMQRAMAGEISADMAVRRIHEALEDIIASRGYK
jgi:multiple sugar transport system substrate-binding protein